MRRGFLIFVGYGFLLIGFLCACCEWYLFANLCVTISVLAFVWPPNRFRVLTAAGFVALLIAYKFMFRIVTPPAPAVDKICLIGTVLDIACIVYFAALMSIFSGWRKSVPALGFLIALTPLVILTITVLLQG